MQCPLDSFFAGYPRFKYDSNAPVSAQYQALCRLYGFSRKPPHVSRVHADYQLALTQAFEAIYGKDVNNLGNLQSLSRVLEIDPIPQTVWACQAAIREVHVNLVDLVDWGKSGGRAPPCKRFGTLDDLADYTRMTRKFFPQGKTVGTLLKFLLRHIL
ncbi:hypothetical protein K438DRAFT_1621998 [Mycena galopus ATCC 62051]|nr:hypothetical protein K438DRAFT_1621998 [Mycena galopus ATCC 62051]